MRFADIRGQDVAVDLLHRALQRGRLASAYLFDGPDGVGKRSAAIGLGLALACPRSSRAGCGACDTCRRMLAGHHPDLRVVAPATAQILLEQAQAVVALASERPHEAPARVLVIDQADRLNPSAANCLLKTLEEPFPGTHVVLVTSAPERLLPTLRSRTQRVRFLPLGADVLAAIARGRGADPVHAETAAALAGGSVARLIALLEADAAEGLWRGVTELRRAAAQAHMGPLFDVAAAMGDREGKHDLPASLSLLARFYRDGLASAAGAPDLVLLRERQADVDALASAAARDPRLGALRRALAAVCEADAALAGNVNPVAAAERLMLEMRAVEGTGVT